MTNQHKAHKAKIRIAVTFKDSTHTTNIEVDADGRLVAKTIKDELREHLLSKAASPVFWPERDSRGRQLGR